jgi:nitroreductase
MIRDLILKNRSYRRFAQEPAIDRATLETLIDLARLSSSGGNLQPLKFLLSCDPERNARIFAVLEWAAYYEDWPGPAEGERPTAYVVVCHDRNISEKSMCDHGIASQSVLLGAAERGIGGCMLGSVDRPKLRAELGIAQNLRILMVVALGYPGETIQIEAVGPDGSIRYWRDEQGVHHVPKRKLADLVVG